MSVNISKTPIFVANFVSLIAVKTLISTVPIVMITYSIAVLFYMHAKIEKVTKGYVSTEKLGPLCGRHN